MIFFSVLSVALFLWLVWALWESRERNVTDVFPEPPPDEDEYELEEEDFSGDN